MDLFNLNEKKIISEEPDFLSLSQEEQEALAATLLTKMHTENKTLKEVLGIDDLLLEQIYTLAHTHYSQGKYKEALVLFRMLAHTDSVNFNYIFGCASACHQLKDYYGAILGFTSSLQLEPENPSVTYYLADSFFHLNMLEEAEEGFGIAAALCGEKEEHQTMKKQALLLKNALKKK